MRRSRSVRRAARRDSLRPAMRAGLNPSPITLPDADVSTLDEYLDLRFGPGSASALDRGDVFADGGVRLGPGTSYEPGHRVWLFRPVPDEPDEPITLDVLYEDGRILAVDKPHDMATIPRGSFIARTVTVAARRQFANDHLSPAHRLDAGTAGVVLLTKTPAVRGAYQKLFDKRRVAKVYEAIAPARADLGEGATVELRIEKSQGSLRTDVVPGEPNASTDVRLVRETGSGLGLYELRPHTGRTHQIRVTLESLGIPIVGDPLYPEVLSVTEASALTHPLQLLSRELAFVDPVTGADRVIRSRQTLALAD